MSSSNRGDVSLEALCHAAQTGDLTAVEAITRAQPQFAHTVSNGKQAIHHAAREGHADIVRFLLDHGANPKRVIYWEHLNAREIAEVNGHQHVVNVIDAWQRSRSPQTMSGNALCEAARTGDVKRVVELLEREPGTVNDQDGEGNTALHIAAGRGDLQLIGELLKRNVAVDMTNVAGMRPIHIALRVRGRRGFDRPDSPLLKAAAGMLLAGGAEYDLWTASGLGDLARVRKLIETEPAAVNHRHLALGGTGYPLSIAAFHGHLHVARFLLDNGADPNTPYTSHNGYVVQERGHPLHFACSNNDMAMAKLLLRHGANPNTIIDASGCAMDRAVNHANKPLVELLLRHGGVFGWNSDQTCEAKPTPGFVAQLSDDYTVDAALLQANPDLASQMLGPALAGGHPTLVELCLRHNPSFDGARQVSLLKGAARMWRLRMPANPGHSKPDHYYECFELLLKHGFSPNGSGGLSEGILHALANPDNRPTSLEKDRIVCAGIALRYGAELNAVGGEAKSTPLAIAIRNDWLELAGFFLEQGADPAIGGTPATTPLAWAVKRGHTEMAERLRKAGKSGMDTHR